MLWYFSRTMSAQLGGAPYDGSYDGFVALSREITRGRSAKQQQDVVDGILGSLLPPQAPANFRKWFPLNRRNAEFNAWVTTLGFGWLVGPSEVVEVEVEFEGRPQTWRSGVKIEKCRYLENSGCVGMVRLSWVGWVGGFEVIDYSVDCSWPRMRSFWTLNSPRPPLTTRSTRPAPTHPPTVRQHVQAAHPEVLHRDLWPPFDHEPRL
jgi:hypothetical protein